MLRWQLEDTSEALRFGPHWSLLPLSGLLVQLQPASYQKPAEINAT